MSYSILQPPFTLDFPNMSKPELYAYFDWFMEQIPVRIRELERAVRASPRFRAWRANASRRSLEPLGEWLLGQAKYRTLTAREKAERRASTFPFEPSGVDLTLRTYSLAVDIGMYLSAVMRKQHPQLEWFQVRGSKNDVHYGQPVLLHFFSGPFNPVRIAVVLANRSADKECDGRQLRKVYQVWSEKALGGRRPGK